MKRLQWPLLLLFLALPLFLTLPPPALAAETAYQAVVRSTDQLLAKLGEVEPLMEADPERFYAEVDAALSPYIDFESFAKGVMGKHGRAATAGQRLAFQQTFRNLLVRTYAKALVGFENQRVEVLEPKGKDKTAQAKEGARSVVRLEVHGSSGDVFPVQYQLVKRDGQWLLRNLIVNGINVGLQFRSQFAASMEERGGDLDEVIDNWKVEAEEEGG